MAPGQAACLQAELKRLQGLGLGVDLREVVWAPKVLSKLGEVRDRTVLVYVENLEAAICVVRHEVVHHEIARCQAVHVNILNAVLAAVNQAAYEAAESLTNRIAAALSV